MLKFNSYRAKRYLRSRFVEGKYLLSSELGDVELELIEELRRSVESTLGSNVAIEDAWKVQKLSSTQLLVSPGEAWVRGLPLNFRSGKDQLVSGAILSEGIVPVGVIISDDASGLGKIITFNNAATSPTNLYRIVVTVREELITEIDDPFLQNANLSESTAQKVRLLFQLNVVPDSLQTEAPIPYRDEASTSGVTNFPNSGGSAAPNLVNQIEVTPIASGNGELISITPITGSEKIDGRDLEVVIRNNTAIGGGIILPNSPTAQLAFSNGALIDSYGNRYHINQIFNDTISTQLVIRLDKEPDQPNPQLVNTLPYFLQKRDVYVTDDVNGSPQGKMYWEIAKINWHQVNGLVHQSSVTDLRIVVKKQDDFQNKTNEKFLLSLVNSGILSWNTTSSILTWSSLFKFINPAGPNQTISSGLAPLVDGGSLVYDLKLGAGGSLEKGTLAINVMAFGTTSTLLAVDLSTIKLGNVVVDSAGFVTYITAIDDVNNTITTNAALTANGAATIYKDSYGPEYVEASIDTAVLATRNGTKVYVGGMLELEDGEQNQLGDGIPQNLLAVFGSGINEGTTAANYTSNIRGTVGEGFQERLGILTDTVGDEQEDRSAYLRSVNEVTWTGTQLEFASDIILEILNTKSGTTTTHTIQLAGSPIVISNGESVWVKINRALASENLTINKTGTLAIPAQTQADKDVFVLFKRIDAGGAAYLHLPFTKQVINEGQTTRLGASGSGTATIKATYLDPISSTLPTGTSVTIDGIAGVNGDLVLFTNLSANNNRIYELGGVGVSLTWTAKRAFNGTFDPTDGDSVRILKGAAFKEQLAIFDSLNFKVNDVIRFFNGISADYWELGSLKTVSLLDNTINGEVFNVAVTGSENWVVTYSISRSAGIKETGQLFITSDGTSVNLANSNAFIGDTGITFDADINLGNIRLLYTSTNTGVNATMKLFTMRWANSSGGPGGVPNYGTSPSSPVLASGAIGDIQYKGSSGNLAGDSRFKWDDSEGAANLNGLLYKVLQGPILLLDNQSIAATVFTYNVSNKFAIIEYSVLRNTSTSVGRLLVTTNGSTVSISDDNTFVGSPGVTFFASISGSNVVIQYTTTNTGFNADFKYSFRRWS